MRVLFDSNIYISAIVCGGIPELVLFLAPDHCEVIGALCVQEEIRRILASKKFNWRIAEVEEVIKTYFQHIECFEIGPIIAASRDVKDDAVLACALAGDADYLITGDKDLLVLKRYKRVRILTPRQFVEML